MRIRTKFLVLIIFVSGSFLALAGLSVRTYMKLSAMREATDSGVRLVAQSRRAYTLMKDVVFDLFSPRVYSSLQGVFLSPSSLTTQKEWGAAVDDFREAYEAFMANPELQSLLVDEELKEAYTVAGPMSVRAFAEVEGLRGVFDRIREKYPDEQELYLRIQDSKDESLFEVFDRVRSASFYLGNIFESYLNRFVSGLERQAKGIERQIVIGYGCASALIIALGVLGALAMTGSLLSNLKLVDKAIERFASGDFSSRIAPRGHDEIGLLAERVNLFAGKLKNNVDSLTSLLADVNLAVPDAPDLDRILAIVTDSLLRDGNAECAAIYLAEGGGGGRTAWSGFPPFLALPGAAVRDRGFSEAYPPGGLTWSFGGAVRDGGFSEAYPPGGLAWSFGGAAGDGRLVAACAAGGKAMAVRDTLADAYPIESPGLDPGLRSVVLVPLNVRRRVSGVCLFGRRDRPFTDLEISQLVSFADYAALVVDNAVSNAALMAMRDAEYQALQSQIQPHFLYNILNGLVALNRMGETKGVELSLLALKDMMRYTLEHERWTTVAEEFAFLDRYCRLQKLRFEERLSFSFNLSAESADFRLPKLILQPLVENAVIHGVEPCLSPVRLSVSARETDGLLVLRVEDDGAGCDPAGLESRERIGISNIRERLALLFRSARLDLTGQPGKGFSAEIGIPLEELERS
jgi:GAF domain-containing protein